MFGGLSIGLDGRTIDLDAGRAGCVPGKRTLLVAQGGCAWAMNMGQACAEFFFGKGPPHPPQDQSDHRGKQRHLQSGKSCRPIFGTQTFGSQTPPPPPRNTPLKHSPAISAQGTERQNLSMLA